MFRLNIIVFTAVFFAYLLGITVFPFDLNSKGVMHQLYILSGLICWVLMAEALVIAARPEWIEKLTREPLDRLMASHRKIGWAVSVFALLHITVPLYLSLIPVEQVPLMMGRHTYDSVWKLIWIWLHPLGAFSGIFITLWLFLAVILKDIRRRMRKVSWDSWEKKHRFWAWGFLLLSLHSVRLLAEHELIMPLGWIDMLATAAGCWASVRILKRKEGIEKRDAALVSDIESEKNLVLLALKTPLASVTEAGQFAYLSLPGDTELPHAFTVAGVNKEKSTLFFWIKNAGRWTESLKSLQPGDTVVTESAWGHFLPDFASEKQVWVAGGSGIAPFIGWMEALARQEKKPEVTLFWSVRSIDSEPGISRIRELVSRAGARLMLHETGPDHRRLTPQTVFADSCGSAAVCGSAGLVKTMKTGWNGPETSFRSEEY